MNCFCYHNSLLLQGLLKFIDLLKVLVFQEFGIVMEILLWSQWKSFSSLSPFNLFYVLIIESSMKTSLFIKFCYEWYPTLVYKKFSP